MIGNLRALPNTNIWYRHSQEQWYAGELLTIAKEGTADILLQSASFSGPWFRPDVPYGKGKLGCWYFRTPTRHMKKLMALMGVQMTDEDMTPDWYDDEDKAALPVPNEEDAVPVPNAAFVNAVIASELEEHREKKNGNHLVPAGKHPSGKSKHT